jgi:hypothetical protein
MQSRKNVLAANTRELKKNKAQRAATAPRCQRLADLQGQMTLVDISDDRLDNATADPRTRESFFDAS